MGIFSNQQSLDRVAALMKAVSNERRLKILCVLSDGEKCVGDLEKLVDLSQSALSQHLARLRRDEIVATRRDAQTIYYFVSNHKILDLIRYANELEDTQL